MRTIIVAKISRRSPLPLAHALTLTLHFTLSGQVTAPPTSSARQNLNTQIHKSRL